MKIDSTFFLFVVMTLAIGIAMSFQTAINTQLRQYLHSPVQAACLSFSIGTIVLFLMVFLQSAARPTLQELTQIPWFLWLGGLLGVYAITASIYSAPKLGLLTLSGLIIFGQITTSLILDHYALFSDERIKITWTRIFGAIMIFFGVLLTFKH